MATLARNQEGSLLIPLVISIVLLLTMAGFGIWAFLGRQDYKANSDAKSAAAVEAAVAAEDVKKDAAFAQAEKNPLKTYKGPEAFGTLVLQYPKTWAAYVAEGDANSSTPINGYFQPNFVPDVGNNKSQFALRVQVVNTSYDQALNRVQGQVQNGQVTVTPYRLPKVPGILGARLTGQIVNQTQGVMVMLPLRDKTLEIWTEGTQFITDFNTNVLPNTTFSP